MENKIINLLKLFVSINSAYPLEHRLSLHIEKLFKKTGFKLRRQFIEKNRFNIIIEKGVGKKSLLLYSHLDTIGITDGWKTKPLKLTIINGKAYGLGAWDMKGGMIANILAFLNYQPKNYKLKLVFCIDEENISKGGFKLINSSFINDVVCVISTEPAFKYGLQGIITGRIGRAVFNVIIKGKSRHFAFYKKEYDINLLTSDFISRISILNKEFNLEKKQFIFAREINSSAVGMSIPSKTKIELDCAILPPLTTKAVLLKLIKIGVTLEKKYQNNFKLEISPAKRATPFLEPYEVNKNNKFLKVLANSVKKVTNKIAIPYFRSSVADENIFGSHRITTLGLGPIGKNAHAPNEWVSLDSLSTLYKILIHFLSKSEML